MRTSALGLALIGSAILFTTSAQAEEPATTPAQPAAPAADGTVMVHINSATPVTLVRRANATAAWETACIAPCNQRLPVGDEYQVTVPGGDSPPSSTFHLQARDGKVTLDVAAGNKGRASVGTALLVTGAIIAVTGVVVLIAFAAKSPNVAGANGATTSDNGRTAGMFGGGALLFGGLGLGAYGLGTNLANNQTMVGGDLQAAPPAHGGAEPLSRVAASKPTFMLPLFSGKF